MRLDSGNRLAFAERTECIDICLCQDRLRNEMHDVRRRPGSLCRKPSLDERKKKHCDIFLLSPALVASLPTARMAAYTRWGATQTGIHMAKLSSGLHSVWY
jgi:hypothetical protein